MSTPLPPCPPPDCHVHSLTSTSTPLPPYPLTYLHVHSLTSMPTPLPPRPLPYLHVHSLTSMSTPLPPRPLPYLHVYSLTSMSSPLPPCTLLSFFSIHWVSAVSLQQLPGAGWCSTEPPSPSSAQLGEQLTHGRQWSPGPQQAAVAFPRGKQSQGWRMRDLLQLLVSPA